MFCQGGFLQYFKSRCFVKVGFLIKRINPSQFYKKYKPTLTEAATILDPASLLMCSISASKCASFLFISLNQQMSHLHCVFGRAMFQVFLKTMFWSRCFPTSDLRCRSRCLLKRAKHRVSVHRELHIAQGYPRQS